MTEKDFKTNTYYTRIRTGEFDIFMFPNTLSCSRFLRTSGSDPQYVSSYGIGEYYGVRFSTPEEIHWLDECIKKDTFVPREIAMASFKSKEINFIPGKWYKSIPEANGRSGEIYYGKFLEDKDNRFVASSSRVCGNISDNKYIFNSGYIWEPVTDLSEIQPFLPPNHPDRIVKTISVSNSPAYVRCYFCDTTDNTFKKGNVYKTYPGVALKDRIYLKRDTDNVILDYPFEGAVWKFEACEGPETSATKLDSPKETAKPVVSQFLKDDYIVTLQDISASFPKNHVFKQRDTTNYLRVYKDIRGEANGNTIVDISKASLWRYATSQEIMEYDIQNKPVDVTKISNDANSFLYDPEFTMRITMNGQSSLMMLSELLAESIPDCQPLMQNTDGLEMIGKPYDVKSLETVSKYEINNGMPKYVRVVSYGNNHFNHVLCTDNPAPSEFNNNWNQILIQCGRLTDGSFVPATREEYEAFIIENERQEAIGNKSYKDKSLREICDLCNQMFPIGSVVDFSNNGSDIYTIKEKLYINSGSYVSYVGLPIVYRLGEDTLRCSLVSKPVKTIEDLPKKAKMSDVSALTKHQEPVIVNRQKTKRSKLITINK